MHAIEIGSPAHIILSGNARIDFSPCRKALLQVSSPYQLAPGTSVYHSPALYGIKPYQACHGRTVILQVFPEVRHGVDIIPVIVPAQLQVQVRPCR